MLPEPGFTLDLQAMQGLHITGSYASPLLLGIELTLRSSYTDLGLMIKC